MENIYEHHSSSCSSSWKRLRGDFTFYQNQSNRTLKQQFCVTEKLIRDHKEIQGISIVNWEQKSWQRTTLLIDRAVQMMTAKTYVFSDSVLCMGKISDNPVKAWKEKVDWCQNSLESQELDRIDGEPTVFEWMSFQGHTTSQTLEEIQIMVAEKKCLPQQFQGRIISMSIYSGLVWEQNGNKELCVANSNKVTEYTKKIRARSLVVSRARIRHEMVWNSYVQTEWRMGPSC